MKILRGILFVLLVAALAAAFLEWKTIQQLRAELEALRAETQAVHDQRAAAEEALSRAREAELQRLRAEAQDVHKLRNEVRQLRTGASEAEKLRAENQQLRVAASAVATSAATSPAPAAAGNNFPKENWAFSGYATPEAALVSAVWAMKEGNPKTYLESLSPEEQVRMAKAWENKSETEVAAKHQSDVASITGVRILEQQVVKDDEVVMVVHVEGVGKVEKVTMKLVGNDWKFGGFIRTPAK